MKVACIFPNAGRTVAKAFNPPLAFAVVAGHSPPDVEIELFDERIESIPDEITADLVAISANTFVARRAYEIADRVRASGTTVVMGGYHPSFEPAEAIEHADSVVIGQAEYCWSDLIEDFRAGNLRKIYGSLARGTFNIRDTVYRYDIFKSDRYLMPLAFEYSRGCRGVCEFCSISSFNAKRFSTQDPEAILQAITRSAFDDLYFVDDNIFNDRRSLLRLLNGLIPLHKRWFSQISLDVARDDEVLSLMKQSGCQVLQIGFESLNVENLRRMRKGFNMAIGDYPKAIANIRRHGLAIHGFFMVGYDFDTADVFEVTRSFATANRLDAFYLHPVSPMPGTDLFARYKREGRIIGERPWLEPDFRYGKVYHVPHSMSVEDFRAGVEKYSLAE